tara:strand:+ start:187 stop:489 length:303 start_codon:yes stop_codon:yes gene_type:complete
LDWGEIGVCYEANQVRDESLENRGGAPKFVLRFALALLCVQPANVEEDELGKFGFVRQQNAVVKNRFQQLVGQIRVAIAQVVEQNEKEGVELISVLIRFN